MKFVQGLGFIEMLMHLFHDPIKYEEVMELTKQLGTGDIGSFLFNRWK